MANTKSAAKSARQGVKRRARNASVITALKSEQKKFRTSLADGKTDVSKSSSVTLSSALDKAAKRGIIHPNAANRRKSRMAKALAKKSS